MQTAERLRIAVVGGGICGLACAVALAKEGIHAEIFEAAPRFGEIGAGVGFGPNAVKVLHEIGVLEDVLASSNEPEVNQRSFIYYRGMGDHELVYAYPSRTSDFGLGLHRASFLEALVKRIDSKYTHHNKRCTGITVSETTQCPIVHFDDGTTHEADVVLGADGIRSAVRSAVMDDASKDPVVWGNTYCYRGLVPIEEILNAGVGIDLTARPVCFIGVNKHLILFPIRGATIINVVAFVTDRSVPIGALTRPADEAWVAPSTQEELLREYEGWGGDVLKVLGCIQKPNKWMIHVVHPPLHSYVKDRVALLGDAAHAMLPHLGAGAGQALEDAYVLARLLGHQQTNAVNAPIVLDAYNEIRRARAQGVWEGSVRAGSIYAGQGKHGFTTEGLQKDLHLLFDFVWHHDLDADLQRSLDHLQDIGAFKFRDPSGSSEV